MNRKNCHTVDVLSVRPLGGSDSDQYLLELSAPGWDCKPGQFVMIRPVDWGFDLLWGRPFSIASSDERGLTLFIQKVGRGTGRISTLRPGAKVTVWGPLGSTFTMDPELPTLLLAGGMGLAPFIGYSRRHPNPSNLRLILGHRQPLDRFPWDMLPDGLVTETCLEQGPEDLACFIGRLENEINEFAEKGLVLACGPTPFLRTVRNCALAASARAEISLENRMACGVGACLGCVQKDADGHHVQVCTQGPVFRAEDIDL